MTTYIMTVIYLYRLPNIWSWCYP